MAIYYPQGMMTLRVILEDFNDKTNVKTQDQYVFNVVCRRLSVNLNSYREADTFEAEIDFKEFPFDPRSIRAVGVTIHIEDRKKLFKTNNSKNVITPTEESTVFIGFADTDNIELNQDKRTVTLEGRDFTSLLIDQPFLGAPVVLAGSVDAVIRALMDQIESTKVDPEDPKAGLKIVNLTGEDLPTLAKLGISLDPKAGKKNGRPRRTYWDMIQKIISDAGLIAYVSLDQLIINKPRTLYDKKQIKLFVFGENLSDLTFERKIGRQKAINIRVVSLNLENKDGKGGELIEAKIPEEATDAWISDIGIPKERVQVPTMNVRGEKSKPKEAPFLTFRLRDIVDKDHIIRVGEKIYEEVGRQQIEGSLKTKEMMVCKLNEKGARTSLFEATKMRVGMPIDIQINQGDLEGLPNLIKRNEGQNQAAIKRFLKANCYSPKVADAFAESLTKYDTPFFVKEVGFILDQDDGFSMDIGFINFIELPKNLAKRTRAEG